jgi:hypothetical protein
LTLKASPEEKEMNLSEGIVLADIIEIEELEGKIAPDSGSWDVLQD